MRYCLLLLMLMHININAANATENAPNLQNNDQQITALTKEADRLHDLKNNINDRIQKRIEATPALEEEKKALEDQLPKLKRKKHQEEREKITKKIDQLNDHIEQLQSLNEMDNYELQRHDEEIEEINKKIKLLRE